MSEYMMANINAINTVVVCFPCVYNGICDGLALGRQDTALDVHLFSITFGCNRIAMFDWEQCLVRPGSIETVELTMLGILGVKGAQKARLSRIFPDWIVDTLDQARNTEHKGEGGHLHA